MLVADMQAPCAFKFKRELKLMSDIVNITFPDGAVKEFPKGTTTEEIAGSISPGLKKKSIAGKFNSNEIDLRTEIHEDGEIAIITQDTDAALEIMRHST